MIIGYLSRIWIFDSLTGYGDVDEIEYSMWMGMGMKMNILNGDGDGGYGI